MKTIDSLRMLTALTLAAGTAALFSGCGSTANYNQADKTGESMSKYRAKMIHLKAVADETLKSLNQIEISAGINPRKPFELYRENVAALEKAVAKTRQSGQAMREKGEAYFSRWDGQSAQVKNPEVKELTEQRKAKLRSAFDGIKKIADPLNAKLDPWISDLKDLETYLGNDLTATGIQDAKKLFSKAKRDGEEVTKDLDAMVAELNRIAAEMTPAKVSESQPAAAPKK